MKPGYELNHRYKIIESLGEGGMANVYLAHDLVLDRDVSVKLLRLVVAYAALVLVLLLAIFALMGAKPA